MFGFKFPWTKRREAEKRNAYLSEAASIEIGIERHYMATLLRRDQEETESLRNHAQYLMGVPLESLNESLRLVMDGMDSNSESTTMLLMELNRRSRMEPSFMKTVKNMSNLALAMTLEDFFDNDKYKFYYYESEYNVRRARGEKFSPMTEAAAAYTRQRLFPCWTPDVVLQKSMSRRSDEPIQVQPMIGCHDLDLSYRMAVPATLMESVPAPVHFHGLSRESVEGKGGTFDGAGASGDWVEKPLVPHPLVFGNMDWRPDLPLVPELTRSNPDIPIHVEPVSVRYRAPDPEPEPMYTPSDSGGDSGGDGGTSD